MSFSIFFRAVTDAITEGAGVAEVACLVLLVALVVIWRALLAERARCQKLTTEMIAMSREVTIMIERITGR